jgi:hypothetical protein
MNDSLPEQNRCCRAGRNWLFGLTVLPAACAIAWLLAAQMGSPFQASCVLIAAIGWVLYRFARANILGIVLWCLSAAVISRLCKTVMRAELFWEVNIAVGALLPIVTSIVFLVAAAIDRRRRIANCGGCVLALFTLVAWIAGANTLHNAFHMQEDSRETTRTLVAVHKLAQEVDSIRAHLGRLPKNEEELIRLRGKPMPTLGARHSPIQYYRTSDVDYRLSFGLRNFWGHHWDLWGYVASYYGPNTTPRLFVDLF